MKPLIIRYKVKYYKNKIEITHLVLKTGELITYTTKGNNEYIRAVFNLEKKGK